MAEQDAAPAPEADDEEDAPKKPNRDTELSRRRDIREKLLKLYDNIEAGFVGQADRSNDIMDRWDIYKCRLSGMQFYNGNSKIFLPIVPAAIRARATRFVNQCFPNSGRYIDAFTADGDIPYAEMALMEHYIRQTGMKNRVIKPMCKNGDIEGNYSLYVDWKSRERKVIERVQRAVIDQGEDRPDFGEVDDIEEKTVEDFGPDVEVIADSDLLILPVTASTIEDALEAGGSVTVRRRWTKATIEHMIKEGDIDKKAGAAFIESFDQPTDQPGRRDAAKKQGEAAGIRINKGMKVAFVAETWTKLKVNGERVLCRAYFGGEDIVLGCKRNPYWCDKVPVITAPVDRDSGTIKGRAPSADVVDLQIYANDLINEAADVSHLSAMPIVMADPAQNPKSSTMVLGLAAVWDVNPDAVKFVEFPPLYKDLLEVIDRTEQKILQVLGVNPAMMPQSSGKPGTKRNQAEIANEQQVDILTTADACSVIEDVLNQVLDRFIAYDHQFRDKGISVQAFGPMGRRANMEEVGPLQLGRKYQFVWLGVESARNAAMAQQQIAALGTLQQIPPDKLPGYRLDLSAAVQQIALTQFGPRIAPLVLVSLRDQQGLSPEEENEMLDAGFDLTVHPTDDDLAHMRAHMQDMQQMGDPHGNKQAHMVKHDMQRQAKAMASAQQSGGSGMPPGGGDQQGGNVQQPRPGSMITGPKAEKSPPGSIAPDQMPKKGAVQMPRKM